MTASPGFGISTSREEDEIDADTLLKLKEFDVKDRKKAQQRGRKKARELATSSRKFRKEKRKADENSKFTALAASGRQDNVKVSRYASTS